MQCRSTFQTRFAQICPSKIVAIFSQEAMQTSKYLQSGWNFNQLQRRWEPVLSIISLRGEYCILHWNNLPNDANFPNRGIDYRHVLGNRSIWSIADMLRRVYRLYHIRVKRLHNLCSQSTVPKLLPRRGRNFI
jgi:hypothetical protein